MSKEFGLKLKIGGDITDILGSLKNLQGALNSVEMPDGLFKGLDKQIISLVQKIGEFEKKSESAINSLQDSKDISNAWKAISKELTALQVKLEDIDSSKIFPKDVKDNIQKATDAAKEYTSALEKAKDTDTYKSTLKSLNDVAEKQAVVESSRKKARQAELAAEANYFQKKSQWTDEINKKYEEQQKRIADINQKLDEQKKKATALNAEQASLQAEGYFTQDGKVSSKKRKAARELPAAENAAQELGQTLEARKKAASDYKAKNSGKDLSKDKEYLTLKKQETEAEKEHARALERVKQLKLELGDASKLQRAENLSWEIGQVKEYTKELREQAKAAEDTNLTEQKKELDAAASAYSKATKEAKSAQDQYDTLAQEVQRLNDELKRIQTEGAAQQWNALVQVVKAFTGVDLTESAHDMEAFTNAMNAYREGAIENLPETLKELKKNAAPIPGAMENIKGSLEEAGESAKELTEAQQEVENLKKSILGFFSITNSIDLFKRAVSSAMNTIKELDATMTEAAVVTDFSVGDMWDKLPQYSKEAQRLGVSINGMYQATTLYYQQGLKTNEAMAIGVETMKMAKIANLDSTEATKAMTSALRGFNMELNETSATRVNDVYSQLAAVTAADTAQIATAMEKTASIAASANMEFETTAALLAQIIETTQEAPETAGTAMKTIIARFSEVKSLQNQGLTSGKDSEGEDLDVNKIQTALKSVGISMDSFFQGTEGLDSVLLKLAEKWDTLDFQTQRYIATTAAGSRQQSRFIAMMSDYARTTELVGEAQNSAGASQRQFEKTQDSMEAKLQKLKNAWDQFLMGLSNNEILKGAVDFLTFVIESVNKLTDALSGGNGLIKSLISLTTVISGLKAGKNIIGAITGQGLEAAGERLGITTDMGKKDSENGGSQGLKTAVIRASEAKKQGAGFKGTMRAFFTSGENTQLLKEGAKVRTPVSKKGQEKLAKRQAQVDEKKKDFLERATDLEGNGELDVSKVEEAYDAIIQRGGDTKQAAEAANAAIKDMGGSMVELAGDTEAVSLGLQGSTLNLDSLGAAATGVGGILMLLSSAFEALGLEELAEPISIVAMAFTGLGSVMSLVSTVAPALGISFTTAGIQIGAAGAAATTPWMTFLPIAIAVVAIIGVLALAVKTAKESTDEWQLERINEQIEGLSSAAEDAKERLDELASARDELEEMQNTFAGLTRGTKEWKKALIENNQKVLDLVDTYPQLMEYVTKGINGELTFKEGTWDSLIEQQEAGYTTLLNAKTVMQQQKDEKELDILAGEKFYGYYNAQQQTEVSQSKASKVQPKQKTTSGAMSNYVDGYDSQKTEQKDTQPTIPTMNLKDFTTFAAAAAEQGLTALGESDVGEWKAVFDNLKETGAIDANSTFDDFYNKMTNMGAAFDELANAAMLTTSAEEMRLDSIKENIAQSSSVVQSSQDFGEAGASLGMQAFEDGYTENVESEAEVIKARIKKVQEDKNLDDADVQKDLQEYADLQGMTLDEVKAALKNDTLSADTIANVLATSKVDKKVKTAMEGSVKVLSEKTAGKSKREIAQLKGLVTDRGLGMGIGDISAMSGKTKEEMSTYLTSLGFSEADAKAMGYETMDAFVQAMYENAQNASTAYENAFNDLNTYGMGETFKGQIESLNASLIQLGSTTGLTVEQTQSLANAMAKVTANGGQTSDLLSQFPQLLAGLSGQNLDTAISILSATDWTTTAGIDSTIDALKSLGVNIDEQLVDKIYLASKAVKKLDFEKLENELSNLSQLKKSIEDKDGAKTFTKEEKNALLASGFGEGRFVRTDVDEYTFMGETNELLSAIETYTSKILSEMQGDLEESVTKGQKFEDYFNSGAKVTIHTGEDQAKSQIDAEIAIQRMIAGTLDTYNMGTRNNIYRDNLIPMVRALGILDHVEGWYKAEKEGGYTAAMMMEAVKSAYLEYYGYGGETHRQKEKQAKEEGADLKEYEYSEAVGTDKFWDMEAELAQKRGRLAQTLLSNYRPHEVDYSNEEWKALYKAEFATNPEIKGKFKGLQSTINSEGLYNAIVNDKDFVEKYQSSETIRQAMAIQVTDLGVGSADMSFLELYEALKAYNDELSRGELTQDAYIQKHAGLEIAFQQAAEDLKLEGEELKENGSHLKNLIIRSNEAKKTLQSFHGVLEDQIDAFKTGDKYSDKYQAALSKITTSAKEVFGEHIEADFVEQYDQLFIQMAQGGPAAEEAFMELGKKSAMAYLKSLGTDLSVGADVAFQQISSAIPPDLKIGVTADVTDAVNELIKMGYTADQVAGAMRSMGYVVEYKWQDMTYIVDDQGNEKFMGPGDLSHATSQKTIVRREAVRATVRRTSGGGGSYVGGGGGGAGKSDYENPYDRLHNTYQKINDLLRERENLERRYQRLIDHNLATAEKMAEISKRNIQNQEEEIEKQKEIIAVRKAEVEAEIGANIGMSDYVYTETDELGNQSIRINWENISAITDDKEEERVKNFYDKIAEKLESIYEAQNALLDAEDAIWEELQQGKDEYLDLERQVKDAIINQRQKEIDELTTINDSITETNSNLLESMQNQIDQYRQNRDNEKTEEEIADKQRRLAYLQQDTSGANALEILNLQKEIEESQESYTDQLIDQKITELQEQNDQAAEQRQQQIDIMQAQLDQYSQSNQIWDQVSKIIDQGTSEIGGLVKGSELESLLKTADAFEGMSKIQKMDWLNQINNQIASALVWMGQGAYTTLAEGGKVSFVNKDGKTVTGIVNDRGEVEVETEMGKAIYTDIAMDAYGNLRSSQTEADAIDEANRQARENENIETEADQVATNLYGVKPSDATSEDRKEGIYVQALQAALNQMGYNAGAIDGKFGTSTKNALKAFQQSAAMKEKYPNYSAYGTWDDKTNEVLKMVGYKTGGLADFTGPAWLDGTKSRPEYILNADQTKAFFSLVDVLTSLRPDSFQTTQNAGDNVYDIDINVESIGSDYDVEQLANTIKHLINEDARYRNNNTINLMR